MLANPLEDLVKMDDTWLNLAQMVYDNKELKNAQNERLENQDAKTWFTAALRHAQIRK